MLVVFSVYRGGSRQASACALRDRSTTRRQHKGYHSLQEAKSTFLSFGFAEEALDECLKLVPQLGKGERVKFPPLDVPHHDLVAAGFGEFGWT